MHGFKSLHGQRWQQAAQLRGRVKRQVLAQELTKLYHMVRLQGKILRQHRLLKVFFKVLHLQYLVIE